MTISTKTLASMVEVTTTDPSDHTQITFPQAVPYCLDAGDYKSGKVVTISTCYPSPSPSTNRDISQHWIWEKDSTIRPFANQTLCLTNTYLNDGNLKITIEDCQNRVEQSYGYAGPAKGNFDSGVIIYGADSLGVIAA